MLGDSQIEAIRLSAQLTRRSSSSERVLPGCVP